MLLIPIFAIICGAFGHGSGSISVDRDPSSDLLAAQCRTRCLSRLQTHGETQMVRRVLAKATNYLFTCINEPECQQCIKPCNQPFVDCDSACKPPAEQVCMDSCQALVATYALERTSGTCPSTREQFSLSGMCEDECQHDIDCARGRDKCCETDCGKVCLEPIHHHPSAPGVPAVVHVRERPNGDSFSLTWDALDTNITSMVLYVVQFRWNVGHHASEQHSTPWQHVAQTTRPSLIVRNVSSGKWYHFRVAAVSINGSHGFSQPSQPLRLNKAPSEPGPPMNVTVTDQVTTGSRVSVTVHWMAPRKSDLPITRYKVFWSRRVRDESSDEIISIREQKKVVNADRLQFTIQELDVDHNYLIQVQAMSQFGDTRLKGERSGVHVSTHVTSHASRQVDPTALAPHDISTPAPYDHIQHDTPYYENGLLKVNLTWRGNNDPASCLYKSLIQWTPVACIAHNNIDGTHSKPLVATTYDKWFEIYDLRFSCRYSVKVSPVCLENVVGKAIHIIINTPECRDVEVRGNVHPDCPTRLPRVPDVPVNLEYSFLIVHTNITARISWEMPQSDAPVHNYRLTWGQTAVDNNHNVTKVLSSSLEYFSIPNLDQSAGYMVRLQALSEIGDGQIASIYFTTPMLENQRGPAYKVRDTVNPAGSASSVLNAPSLADENRSHPKRSGASTVLAPEQLSTPVTYNHSVALKPPNLYLNILVSFMLYFVLRQCR